jgi:hypothetical protein
LTRLTIQTTARPTVTITRQAVKVPELVYIAVANKLIKYPSGQSRIVYIGQTKNGARRIAASAARKASDILGEHGITHLEFFVVTSTSKADLRPWRKLERGLLLAFKEIYGAQPNCNIVGKKMKWTDELKYFTLHRLKTVIGQYSNIPISANKLPARVKVGKRESIATLRNKRTLTPGRRVGREAHMES